MTLNVTYSKPIQLINRDARSAINTLNNHISLMRMHPFYQILNITYRNMGITMMEHLPINLYMIKVKPNKSFYRRVSNAIVVNRKCDTKVS